MVDVRNRDDLETTRARETALECVVAGIEAAHPDTVVRNAVSLEGATLRVGDESYGLERYDEIVAIGGGKAAAQVAAALESVLGERLSRGAVVTNDPVETERVTVLEGAHPVPDAAGRDGARRVLEIAEAADERTLILAVVTGGGSALLPAPAGDVSLEDLQAVTGALLESGATIDEINALRKHCSAIKGGLLARAAAPATVVTLAFSDVVGDDPAVIASGPTVPDESTYDDALEVLERYDVDVPDGVGRRLERGAAGEREETPEPDDPAFDRSASHVLASARTAVDAAAARARDRGYETLALSTRVRGEAREAALSHVAVAEDIALEGVPISPPAVVLSGGETTVTVRGDGTGGPNQEFGLSGAIELAAGEFGDRSALATVDTDGIDGATDAAGALVDGWTVDEVAAARSALDANDAFPFLESRDALVRTGSTGTNVNDLRAIVIE